MFKPCWDDWREMEGADKEESEALIGLNGPVSVLRSG